MPFTLFAEPEVHQFIFSNGLGELTHRGFGMLDLTGQQFTQRTEPYDYISGAENQSGASTYGRVANLQQGDNQKFE
jgi:hypothetical protein